MTTERDRVALRPEQATIPPGHAWNRLPAIGAACALLGAVACAILGAANPKQFFFSWLVSFLFFLSLALGALFFVLIQYATQGGWGIVVRRIGEIVFATLPVMAALFVPLLFGLHDLYPWSVPGAAEHDALLRWKAPYLNVPFFLIRAPLYFGCWSFIALIYYRRSRGQDSTGDPRCPPACAASPVPAIIVLALTQTFASVDWIMSLTPHWYSTMFGVYFFAGSFVGFIALLSVVAVAMRSGGPARHGHQRRAPARCRKAPLRVHGVLGLYRLLPVLPHLVRQPSGGDDLVQGEARRVLVGGLAVHHGGTLRGAVLLPDGACRQTEGNDAGPGGAWLLTMHFVDLYWQVMPTLHPEGVPSVAARRRRAPRRRRILRGGHELADEAAGARPAARSEAGGIARVRERLSCGRVPRARQAVEHQPALRRRKVDV